MKPLAYKIKVSLNLKNLKRKVKNGRGRFLSVRVSHVLYKLYSFVRFNTLVNTVKLTIYKPFLKSSSIFSLTSDLNLVSLELVRKKVTQEVKKHRLLNVNMKPTTTEATAPVKSRDFFFSPCRTITKHEKTANRPLTKKWMSIFIIVHDQFEERTF